MGGIGFALRALFVLSMAVALGVVGRASDHLSYEPRLLFALGAPWLVLAFVSGFLWRRPLHGAIAGAGAVALSVAVYYLVMVAVEDRAGPHYGAAMIVLWGGLGVLVGAVFGAAGAAGGRHRIFGAALLGGALLGEAAFFFLRGQPEDAVTLLMLEAAVGATIPVVIGIRTRRLADAMSLTAALALTAFVADAAFRVAARRYGWGGY